MPLTPDSKNIINGLTVYTYNLVEHNPNKIDMPKGKRKKTVAITIHNTEWINVASNTTPAEQYVRATQNGAMKSTRVNYYVDNVCAWQCMPDDYVNWSCADGTSNPNSGNNTSLAIEVIGKSKEAEANVIKLAAFLLKKYNLTVENGLRTHTYWLNVKDGKKGAINSLNVLHNPYKDCPAYILPHWSEFKAEVIKAYNALTDNTPAAQPTPKPTEPKTPSAEPHYYRIRKSWDDPKSQIGAFTTLDNAIKKWQEGYFIYDWEGNVVYPVEEEKQPEIIYCAYATNKWNSDIINYNDKNSLGFAGIQGYPMNGLAIKTDVGKISYRVHIKNGGWLSWITKFDKNDWYRGCAGYKTQQIDGVQISLESEEYNVKYRVSARGQDYYQWKIGGTDYAGRLGYPIDRIQIGLIKKQ